MVRSTYVLPKQMSVGIRGVSESRSETYLSLISGTRAGRQETRR
jgi:hypothetical protein